MEKYFLLASLCLQLFSLPLVSGITDIFSVPLVLPFPECRINGITESVCFHLLQYTETDPYYGVYH